MSQVSQDIAKLIILVNVTDTIIYLHKSIIRLNFTNLSHMKTSHYVITSIIMKFWACIVQACYSEAMFLRVLPVLSSKVLFQFNKIF